MRKHAGVTEHNRTLSDDQRGKAYDWLQHDGSSLEGRVYAR